MTVFDVAVIGGGITGASAANHLVAAGFTTLLLEANDFGSGTTSRTSRLQYSGLAYLSAFNPVGSALRHPLNALASLRLARRAMRDRSAFIRSVPERLGPVPLFLPIYPDGPVSLRRMMAGFRLLERLDPGGVPLAAGIMRPDEIRRDPRLRWLRDPDRLVGVIRCVEYQYVWPERICSDVVFNAEENGARVENYMPVESLRRERDGVWRIGVADRRTGATHSFRARAVLNAAGAWVDDIARASSLGVPVLNRGEKGSNIVVRLPSDLAGVGFEGLTRGGAPYYVLPWGKLHYFGPVNRPHAADRAGYTVGEDEIAKLLDELNWLFPEFRLARHDVLYSWAGVRPRTARGGAPSGGSAVRLHDLTKAGAPRYFAYTGGLLMTHRSAGREVVAGIGRRLRPSAPPRPLLLSARMPPTQADVTRLQGADGAVEAVGLLYACTHEKVFDLEDVMRRRVPLGWGERLGCDLARDVAETIRGVMGWSEAEAETQVARYRQHALDQFGLA